MSEIIVGEQKESTAHFCPKCQTPIDLGQLGTVVLVGNAATPVRCAACDWHGDLRQVLQTSFKHEFKSDDEIFAAMMVDLRNILAKNAATTYGRWLLKWGFLDQPVQSAQLGLYIMEIAKAVTTAVIQVRKAMVEEKARGRNGG
jgi:hypothetical protein